jgi:hypothetical protein
VLDTREMVGKIGPRLVLPVNVVGVGGIPGDATAAIVTVTSVEPCADGFVTLFPCGSAVPTSAVLNAPREKIVSNSAVVMLGGGSICVFNNEPTDVVLDVVGWIGPDGPGVEFTAPVRLVDTRLGETQALTVPQRRVPARTGVTIDLRGSTHVPSDAQAITFNLTAVDPSAAGFVSSLPGRCSDQSLPPATASLTYEARRTTGVSATVGVRDAAICVYSSAEMDLVVDLQSVHIINQHFVLPISPLRLVDTRITGPIPTHTGVDLDAVLGDAAFPYASGVIVNIAGVAPTRSGYIVVYSCSRPTAPFVSSLNVSAGTTVSNRAFVPLELGRALCVYSNIPTNVVIDIEAWVP